MYSMLSVFLDAPQNHGSAQGLSWEFETAGANH